MRFAGFDTKSMGEPSVAGRIATDTLELSQPGAAFAEIEVGGTISWSLTGSVSGELTPDTPSLIKPKSKPKGEASCLVAFPITGSCKVENRTLLVGASGELSVTVNNPIGPLKLTYEAEDNCDVHP